MLFYNEKTYQVVLTSSVFCRVSIRQYFRVTGNSETAVRIFFLRKDSSTVEDAQMVLIVNRVMGVYYCSRSANRRFSAQEGDWQERQANTGCLFSLAFTIMATLDSIRNSII